MRRAVILLSGLILGIGIGLVIIFVFLREEPPKISEIIGESESTATLAVDSPAPGFELESLPGEQIRLDDFRGHPVILNFWATWCGPCRLEMPAFQDRFEQYGGDLQVIAVNFDEPRDDVQAFIDEFDLTFTILLDPGAEVQKLYRVRGYPTTYIVDAEGIVRIQHIGLMTEDQLDGYLAEIGFGE